MENNKYECEFMTNDGCEARNTAKALQAQVIMEGAPEEMTRLCSEKCCYECKLISECAFRCGKAMTAERKANEKA